MKSFNYGAYGDVIGEEGGIMQTGPRCNSSMPEVFGGAYGIRRDTTTGLDYMRFRWYANDLSSFISADRIRGTNRYAYAKGNPVKYVDPMGLWTIQGVIDYLITIGAQEYADLLTNYTVQPNGNIQLTNGIQISPEYLLVEEDDLTEVIPADTDPQTHKIRISTFFPNEIAAYLLMEELNHVLYLKEHNIRKNQVCKETMYSMEYLAKIDIAKYYKPLSTKHLKPDIAETERIFYLKNRNKNKQELSERYRRLKKYYSRFEFKVYQVYVSFVAINSASQHGDLMDLIILLYKDHLK